VDLIAPTSRDEVRGALRDASARGTRIGIVGGRTHDAKGNRCEVDRALSIDALDRMIAYDAAEMLAVVEGGMRIGQLRDLLADGGQEWPVDAPAEATVGGVVATAPTSPRRLRYGPLRDGVVEIELVTGDGRLVRSGARTVKSVQGYDVHRLATGSLGTLGVITQVAVKVRPRPRARRVVVVPNGGVALGRTVLDAVPLPSAVIATPHRIEVVLEGWPEELDEQTSAIRRVAPGADMREGGAVAGPEAIDAATVVEVAVVPSRLANVLESQADYRALLGVGIAWVGLPDDGDRLDRLRGRVAETGGIAPVIRGPGGLGDAPVAALDVHRRLKAAFDPANVLAPGRFWGGA
jgi:glycolate oxidase FAD binding subunit